MFDSLPNQMQGFARNGGEAFHPRLWDYNVLTMAPCLGLAGQYLPDLSPWRYNGEIIGTAWSITESPLGPAVYFNGNAYQLWTASTWGLPTKLPGSTDPAPTYSVTIQAYFRYVHKGSLTKMHLFRSDQTPPLNTYHNGYGLYVEANADDLVFFTNRRVPAGGDHYKKWTLVGGNPSLTLTPGKWHHVILTYGVNTSSLFSNSVMMILDGRWVFALAPSSETLPLHNASYHARCGAATNGNAPDFEIALLTVWGRELSPREIDGLMADPLAMFRRRRNVHGRASAATRLISIGGTALRRVNVAAAG